MAISTRGFLGDTVSVDLTADGTKESILSSGGTLYGMEVDNTQNTDAVFLKMVDHTSDYSVGTDVPDFVFKVPGGAILMIPLGSGVDGDAANTFLKGLPLTDGLQVACVTTGGTGGTTGPTFAVKATFITG